MSYYGSEEHETEYEGPVPVTEPVRLACMTSEEDAVGFMVVADPDDNAKRFVLVEVIQNYDDICVAISELVHEGAIATRVFLTPAQVRQMVAGLMDALDHMDGEQDASTMAPWDAL